MELLELDAPPEARDGSREREIRVVISGTFRKGLEQLEVDFYALKEERCSVLSPRSVDFVAEVDGFVLASDELGEDPSSIEDRHLDALKASDLVWLHAPEGYVGPSGALEIGVASSLGVPIFSREAPRDVALQSFVSVVQSPAVAVRRAATTGPHTPSRPLDTLQQYYRRIAQERGFGQESAQDTMLLLTEEVGELARAVRKSVGLARAGSDAPDPGEELADVQLYLLHLANIIGVDLAAAVIMKEQRNHGRYGHAVA